MFSSTCIMRISAFGYSDSFHPPPFLFVVPLLASLSLHFLFPSFFLSLHLSSGFSYRFTSASSSFPSIFPSSRFCVLLTFSGSAFSAAAILQFSGWLSDRQLGRGFLSLASLYFLVIFSNHYRFGFRYFIAGSFYSLSHFYPSSDMPSLGIVVFSMIISKKKTIRKYCTHVKYAPLLILTFWLRI